ncbi:MAG TPA: SDR family oxidoreductase, partial [Solirubrobacter sp.]|nr:SDR family oxidoreductase [Solirubrobacter sp.]
MDRAKLRTLFDVSGRTAIVTGGTRGIGRAIAEGLVCAGANVVVASRKADACADTEAQLRELAATDGGGGDALGMPTHLGDVDAIAALVDATVGRFGGVDIVVNNAANALALPIGGYTVDAWEKSMAVNLRGPAFLVERALPHLTASNRGVVLNVISVGAFLFSAGTSMYAAGKAGLLALTRSQAAELAGRGIRANALAPGTVMTDMVFNNPPERVE